MMKFHGSLKELQDIVGRCAITGEWKQHTTGGFYRICPTPEAILNWWPNTGTVNFQGQDADKLEALLKHAFEVMARADQVRGDASVWAAVPESTSHNPIIENRKKLAPKPLRRLASRGR
jgi:hypothetical protein